MVNFFIYGGGNYYTATLKGIYTLTITIGVDVGVRGVGFAVVETSNEGVPPRILRARSILHDGGVSPDDEKSKDSRLALNGGVRRLRRARKVRRQRLRELDHVLARHGFPVMDAGPDIWSVWERLISERVEDDMLRREYVSRVVRHSARHRGWRNPYVSVSGISDTAHLSPLNGVGDGVAYVNRVNGLLSEGGVLRSPDCVLPRLWQSDLLSELQRMFEVQGVDSDVAKTIIDLVFYQVSPRGSHVSRVGRDPLPGANGRPRASSSSMEFQEYRIRQQVNYLRVRNGDSIRSLTDVERDVLFDFLFREVPVSKNVDTLSWEDVEAILGLSEGDVLEGFYARSTPLYNTTLRRFYALKEFKGLSVDEISSLEEFVSDNVLSGYAELLLTGPDAERMMGALEKVRLENGRASFSRWSLNRLNSRMRDGLTQDEALRDVFNVEPGWEPPAPPVGEPVGHPSVDRVLKIVARELDRAVRDFGEPDRIVVESVKDSFSSQQALQEKHNLATRTSKLREQNRELLKDILGYYPTAQMLKRWETVERQWGECAYCGDSITYTSCEIDHIIPQASNYSNSFAENCVAICSPCNRSKSKALFRVWAESGVRAGVSVDGAVKRVLSWKHNKAVETLPAFKRLRNGIVSRLKSARLDDVDSGEANMPSVAYMARELKRRISQAHPDSVVDTYSGAITHTAWVASGYSEMNLLEGGEGKQRADLRHHALDAIIFTAITPSVARELARYMNTVRARLYVDDVDKTLPSQLAEWKESVMLPLSSLIREGLEDETICIITSKRLKRYSGSAHEETVRKCERRSVTGAFSIQDIDRASTPELWQWMRSLHDFDAKTGLPENPSRKAPKGTLSDGNGNVLLFPESRPNIFVNGGTVRTGSGVHHVRVYEHGGRYFGLRALTVDMAKHSTPGMSYYRTRLPKSSTSFRQLKPAQRDAIARGEAQMVTHFTLGSTLFRYKGTLWKVRGFSADTLKAENVHGGGDLLKISINKLMPVAEWV